MASAGNQGVCWRVGKFCRGMGTAGGLDRVLRASVQCLEGLVLAAMLGKELSGK